ncbi:MAG TPA: chorismate mutase [Chitinophaga sp.]|uniref:chorismate mutase n=1 Tax=Chitinophaga sp. TaxID=1869181 RepID=UPI002C484A92|nr:chorismate mutase [Chitinophaga sp.]HVI49201.1 chorismate mutase [Chitinophaga sp.]
MHENDNYFTPDKCNDLSQIRDAIDNIDCQIIRLLKKRIEYTNAAHKFKKSEIEVRDPVRVSAVLDKIKINAIRADIDPALIEKLYLLIIPYCIEEQLKLWRAHYR